MLYKNYLDLMYWKWTPLKTNTSSKTKVSTSFIQIKLESCLNEISLNSSSTSQSSTNQSSLNSSTNDINTYLQEYITANDEKLDAYILDTNARLDELTETNTIIMDSINNINNKLNL